MSKFKPGDKVKVREDLEVGRVYGNYDFARSMGEFRGKIVTIEKVTLYGNYKLEEDGERYVWVKEMFEPVPSFGKHLLRDGVIVESRDGSRGIVLGDRVVKETCYRMLNDYDENLSVKNMDESSIVKIYKPTGVTALRNLCFTGRLTLIAKRPEVKEMTLAEICKELGYNVKIVKEE